MDGLRGFGFRDLGTVVETPSVRRPRDRDRSSSSSVSASDNFGYNEGSRRNELYHNDPILRYSSVHDVHASERSKKERKLLVGFDGFNQIGRESLQIQLESSDGYVGKSDDSFNLHQSVKDLSGTGENKLRKVKLKVGGVTQTIHAKSNEDRRKVGPSAKPSCSLGASRHHRKLVYPDDSSPPPSKGDGFQGDQWMDWDQPRNSREVKLESSNRSPRVQASEPIRKSNRVPKKRLLDDTCNGGEKDDEVRHVGTLRTSRLPTNYTMEYQNDEEEPNKRRLLKGSKKCKAMKESNDTDYIKEEEPGSDIDAKSNRKKQKVYIEPEIDVRTEPLTSRQRALQSGKGGAGVGSIEFPNGLPPVPPPSRKEKEKLSEKEQQAKKTEAAQRRKLQAEK